MQRALFDPQRGYYSRKIATVGARGDFSTSASLSPLLGKAVSRWIIEQSRLQPTVRTVIEVGGGDGSLMKTVLQHLGWHRRWRFDFCMVEKSAVLKEQQLNRLGSRVRWFDDIEPALDSCAGRALIYHNEFLDALPVKLAQWDAEAGCWMEVWLVHHSEGRINEVLRPLSFTTNDAEDFSALAQWTSPSANQRCELHSGIKQWLAGLSPHWKMGSMLAIDYGDTFPGLYHRRPNGTLAGLSVAPKARRPGRLPKHRQAGHHGRCQFHGSPGMVRTTRLGRRSHGNTGRIHQATLGKAARQVRRSGKLPSRSRWRWLGVQVPDRPAVATMKPVAATAAAC